MIYHYITGGRRSGNPYFIKYSDNIMIYHYVTGGRRNPYFIEYSDNIMIYHYLYNNQINARALIGQSAVGYCAVNPRKNRASSELLYKSNGPQVFFLSYRLKKNL